MATSMSQAVPREDDPQEDSWIDGGSQGEAEDNGIDDKDDTGGDAEGVWAADIEQAFQEALAIYPPCGRRKIILSDEGKMYGRNELIARYIKLRTGKSRTRKQVSSHIQVLARKKSRELQGKLKVSFIMDQHMKDKALGALANMSSAQIVSSLAIQRHPILGNPGISGPGITGPGIPYAMLSPNGPSTPVMVKTEMAQLGGSPHMSQLFQQHQSVPNSGMIPHGPTYFPFPPPGPILVTPTTTTFEPMPSGPFNSAIPMGLESSAQPNPAKGTLIAKLPLKMMEFTAFVEKQGAGENADASQRHVFVSINPTEDFFKQGTSMEAVQLRHITDKFPEKSGGLKDLFEKGPQDRFFLVKFWADLNSPLLDDQSAFYGVTSQFQSADIENSITCSTKVCSFGKQVVEKVETEYSRREGGRFLYRINRSPMCEYMISFIHRLKHLPEKFMMNSVLDNFTILQVVTNRETQEILLCLAYIFEVSAEQSGSKQRIYRLVKNTTPPQ
uniref:TEAD conserved 1 n=1 Tax=Halisarca dujardinii TaxID=2583056 RepID=A0AA50AFM8_HALDU|nr:TEAD conserved 1 [Halisarca dujardinii]